VAQIRLKNEWANDMKDDWADTLVFISLEMSKEEIGHIADFTIGRVFSDAKLFIINQQLV